MFEELVKMIEVGDLWTRMATQWPVGIHRGSVDMGFLASRAIIQIVYNERTNGRVRGERRHELIDNRLRSRSGEGSRSRWREQQRDEETKRRETRNEKRGENKKRKQKNKSHLDDKYSPSVANENEASSRIDVVPGPSLSSLPSAVR